MTDFNSPAPNAAPPVDNFDPMAYISNAAQPVVHQGGVVDLTPQPPAAQPGQPATAPTPWWQASQAPAPQPTPQAPPAYQAPATPSFATAQAPAPTRWFDPASVNSYGLNAEQQQRFSGSLPVIEQVMNAKLAAMEEAMRSQVSQITSQFESKFGAVTQDNELFFATQIDNTIPDLPSLTQDPAWGQYLAARAPMTGQTMQSLIGNALANRDLRTLKEITDGFRNTRQNAPQPPATVPVTSQYQNLAPHHAPQAQVLPLSAHTRATQDFVMKRISKAQFDQVDAVYRAAVNENRVDYNA